MTLADQAKRLRAQIDALQSEPPTVETNTARNRKLRALRQELGAVQTLIRNRGYQKMSEQNEKTHEQLIEELISGYRTEQRKSQALQREVAQLRKQLASTERPSDAVRRMMTQHGVKDGALDDAVEAFQRRLHDRGEGAELGRYYLRVGEEGALWTDDLEQAVSRFAKGHRFFFEEGDKPEAASDDAPNWPTDLNGNRIPIAELTTEQLAELASVEPESPEPEDPMPVADTTEADKAAEQEAFRRMSEEHDARQQTLREAVELQRQALPQISKKKAWS